MRTTPITLSDFRGGITDDYIGANIATYEEADNLLITDNGKLFTRDGVSAFSDDHPQLPIGAQRIGLLKYFGTALFSVSGSKTYYYEGGDWNILQGPAGADVLSGVTINSVVDMKEWNDQSYIYSSEYTKIQKIYKDGSGVYQCRTAGMPDLETSPSLAGGAGSENYIYAFHYFYSYTVGDTTHIDAGPVTYVQTTDIEPPSTTAVSITNIPILSNGVGDNYDTANIKVKIYRTQANESVLYLIDEVANGTTVYTDTTSDATAGNGGVLYTTGDVLSNDAPPKAKAFHISGGVAYYGNIKESTSTLNYRVLQSVPSDPDSVPAGNYIDFDDEVVGISSYMDRVIVLCKGSIHRIDGVYDNQGLGGMSSQTISSVLGCISPLSIIQTNKGVLFATDQGFGFTDGFLVYPISNNFRARYNSLIETDVQKRRINAAYDDRKERVYFSVQEAAQADNSKIFVLDMRGGITEKSTFTTLRGDGGYNPTAQTFDRGVHILGNHQGIVLKSVEDQRYDVLTSPGTPTTEWTTKPIMYSFKSAAMKPFAEKRAFIPKMVLSLKNLSDTSISITSSSDDNNRVRSIKPLRWKGNLLWGDPLFNFNSPQFRWGVQGYIEEKRYFSSDDLRCTYRQVQLSNAVVPVHNSDLSTTVTVVSSTNSVTMDNPLFEFLPDSTDFLISLETDGYVQQYKVLSGTAASLILEDSGDTLPTATGVKWQMKGVPKREVLGLQSITIMASPLGRTQRGYTGDPIGVNV